MSILGFCKTKIKEKQLLIEGQRTWKQSTALLFIDDRFDNFVDDFMAMSAIGDREEAVELINEAISNRCLPSLEEEVFDIINGGVW